MISAAIMAHPTRTAWVAELRASLDVDATVAWDVDNTEWHTGTAAWRAHNPAADWHLVLQDDALVCDRLVERLTTMLDGADHDGPVSLYLGAGRPRQPKVRHAIRQANGGWVRLPWLLWGVAVALPVRHIDRMLSDLEVVELPYDERINSWFRSGTLYTWPCLVDHRDEGSLLGRNTGTPRRAHWWIGDTRETRPVSNCG